MRLIVISHPEEISNEAEHVRLLLNAGLDTFHLRKAATTEKAVENVLRKFPAANYKSVVIHGHYKLVEKYNLKGIHLTEWFIKNVGPAELKQVITVARKRNLTVSGSFHSVEALENMALKLDYVFLGPVYDSISKKGYPGRIDLEYASVFLKKRRHFEVVAIGGIDELNIGRLRDAGFDGAALLGSVWNNSNPSGKFQIIRNSISA